MKILGIDTSGNTESVALVSENEIIAENAISKNLRPTSKVISLINSVLNKSGFKINEIDAIAVTIGPGSFTGLRIGLATCKGLAFSLNKILIPVSSLQAIIASYSAEGDVAVLMDAKKNEIYGCIFNIQNRLINQITPECVMKIEDFCKNITTKTIFIGEDSYIFKKDIINILGDKASFLSKPDKTIGAGAAFLGLKNIEENRKKNYNIIIPNYIRRSEAEIKLKQI